MEFVFARIHGAWSKAFAGRILAEFLAHPTPEAFRAHLAAVGFDPGEAADDRAFLVRYLRELAAVRNLLPAPSAAFYEGCAARYHVENVKLALRVQASSGTAEELDSLLLRVRGLPALAAARLLRAGSPLALVEATPAHPWKAAMRSAVAALGAHAELFAIESALDRVFYAQWVELAGALPPVQRSAAARLIGLEVDAANFLIVLRGVFSLGLKPDLLAACRLPTGGLRLRDSILDRMAACPNVAAAVAASGSDYVRRLEGAAGVPEMEIRLERLVWRAARRFFRDFNQPAAGIVAYPFLRRIEALDLGRARAALSFAAGAGDLAATLAGAGHV